MKLVFMGTPDFAVPALQALIDSKHEIVAAYTQPPRPAGRGKKLQPSPVHRLAEAHDISVYTPKSLKNEEVLETFRSHEADAAIVAAYGMILPQTVLDISKHGCINIHPSLLPRWRGAAPIQRAIMAGDRTTGICMMQMDAGLDTGDVLMCEEIRVPEDATAGTMHDTLAEKGAGLLLKTLDAIENGQVTSTPQANEGVTYANKIDKTEAKIDWNQNTDAILHHIHGLSPWPGAYFTYNGERIKLLKAEGEKMEAEKTPGMVIDNELAIATKDGFIRPTLIQRQGKKPLARDELLRGFSIPEGTRLD